MRITRLLALTCLLVALLASLAHGYLIQATEAEDLVLGIERERQVWDKEDRSFAVYGNVDLASRDYYKVPVVCPYSRHFAAVDLLAANPTLRIAVYPHETLEGRLTRLLYADLRLKMLVDEYEALRQRTHDLIGGLIDSNANSPPKFGLTGRRESPGSQTQGSVSIHQKKEMLEHEYRSSVDDAPSSNPSPTNTRLSPAVKPGTVASLAERLRSLEQSRVHQPQGSISYSASKSAASQPTRQKGPSQSEDNVPRHSTLEPFNAGPLPWIVRIGLKTVDFLFSHKGEVFLYGLILMGMAGLVGSIKRH